MEHPQLTPTDSPTKLEIAYDRPSPILETATRDLAELALEFAPFTTGLLHTYGGLTTDPVREFVVSHPDSDCDVSVRDFDFLLFDGVGRDASEEAWDRRLFFVERKYWEDLKRFLMGITLVDPVRKTYAEARAYTVPLPVRGDGPRAFATVFGFSGNKDNVRLGLRRDRPGGPPSLMRLLLEPAMVETAHRVFARGPEALQGPAITP